MQIDFNDEQSRNAQDSIRISLEPDSNANEEMEEQSEKHPSHRISISRLNVIDSSKPKYRMTLVPFKSVRKLPETRKCELPTSTVIITMPVCERAEPLIISGDAGMQNDFNDEHPRNAAPSIRVSFDPDSKVNDESDVHQQKEPTQRTSTDAGIHIILSDEQEANEFSSIRVSLDPDSKVNAESNVHSKKQRSQRTSTHAGIQIDRNDEHL
jgi:hypothetical protein